MGCTSLVTKTDMQIYIGNSTIPSVLWLWSFRQTKIIERSFDITKDLHLLIIMQLERKMSNTKAF